MVKKYIYFARINKLFVIQSINELECKQRKRGNHVVTAFESTHSMKAIEEMLVKPSNRINDLLEQDDKICSIYSSLNCQYPVSSDCLLYLQGVFLLLFTHVYFLVFSLQQAMWYITTIKYIH